MTELHANLVLDIFTKFFFHDQSVNAISVIKLSEENFGLEISIDAPPNGGTQNEKFQSLFNTERFNLPAEFFPGGNRAPKLAMEEIVFDYSGRPVKTASTSVQYNELCHISNNLLFSLGPILAVNTNPGENDEYFILLCRHSAEIITPAMLKDGIGFLIKRKTDMPWLKCEIIKMFDTEEVADLAIGRLYFDSGIHPTKLAQQIFPSDIVVPTSNDIGKNVSHYGCCTCGPSGKIVSVNTAQRERGATHFTKGLIKMAGMVVPGDSGAPVMMNDKVIGLAVSQSGEKSFCCNNLSLAQPPIQNFFKSYYNTTENLDIRYFITTRRIHAN